MKNYESDIFNNEVINLADLAKYEENVKLNTEQYVAFFNHNVWLNLK